LEDLSQKIMYVDAIFFRDTNFSYTRFKLLILS